jgi:hypothetical protein
MEGKGKYHQAPVRNGCVQFFEVDVETLTVWTAGLLVNGTVVQENRFRNRLIEQFKRGVNVIGVNNQLYSAEKIRPEPIHPNCVVVKEKRFDTPGFQGALSQ